MNEEKAKINKVFPLSFQERGRGDVLNCLLII